MDYVNDIPDDCGKCRYTCKDYYYIHQFDSDQLEDEFEGEPLWQKL